MTKVDLKEIRKNGIYTVETNPAYNPNAGRGPAFPLSGSASPEAARW